MAKVTTNVTVPVKPPVPTTVTLELTWDEFLLLYVEVGESNDHKGRNQLVEKSLNYLGLRDKADVSGSGYGSLQSLYQEMKKVYEGKNS